MLGDLERYGFFEMSNSPHSRSSGLLQEMGAKEFSIFVFLFSFLPLVSVPLRGKEGGEKKKKEERRMKTGC